MSLTFFNLRLQLENVKIPVNDVFSEYLSFYSNLDLTVNQLSFKSCQQKVKNILFWFLPVSTFIFY